MEKSRKFIDAAKGLAYIVVMKATAKQIHEYLQEAEGLEHEAAELEKANALAFDCEIMSFRHIARELRKLAAA